MKRLIIVLLCLAFTGVLLMGQIISKTNVIIKGKTAVGDDDTIRVVFPVSRVDYNTNYLSYAIRVDSVSTDDQATAADSCVTKVRSGVPLIAREAGTVCTTWTKYVDIPIDGDTLSYGNIGRFMSAMDIQAQIVGESNKHDQGIIPGCKLIEITYYRTIGDSGAGKLVRDSLNVWIVYSFE